MAKRSIILHIASWEDAVESRELEALSMPVLSLAPETRVDTGERWRVQSDSRGL